MICVPIQACSINELKRKISKVPPQVSLIEIWADYLPPEIPATAISKITKRKIIIVNKPKKEKGKWSGSEELRIKRLIEFIDAGVDYVDIGIGTNPALIKKLLAKAKNKRTKVIVSYHNFTKTPTLSTMLKITQKAWRLKADVVKIATSVAKKDDNFSLIQLLSSYSGTKKIVVLGMGGKGIITRIAGLALGNHINYIALADSQKTASGQLNIKQYRQLKDIINFS